MHDLPPPPHPHQRPSHPAQPHLEWALATGFSYLRKGEWIPLLIEFDTKEVRRAPGNERLTALEAFATRLWLADDPRTLDGEFVIPDLFANPPALMRRSPEFNFCVGLIKRDVDVVRKHIRSDRWNRTIVRVDLGPPIDFAKKPTPATSTRVPMSAPKPPSPTLHAAASHRRGIFGRMGDAVRKLTGSASAGAQPPPPKVFAAGAPTTPGSLPPTVPPTQVPPTVPPPPGQIPGSNTGSSSATTVSRVVIAVIDQGIAFANSRFFMGGQPRIEYLWQQNLLGTTLPAVSLTMPFTPGFELDKTAIVNAVAAARGIGANDDWVYRNYGGLNFNIDGYKPLARRQTHGSHVLDLAASVTDPAKHPIIAVDVPEDAVGDPSGSTLSVQAAWGLIYIVDRAEKLLQTNEKLPVVVNISYGPHEGPHDGTGSFEVFMDKIFAAANGSDTPLDIVLAAGNFRQTRTHAHVQVLPSHRKLLRWRLQPAGLTASTMEIWAPVGVVNGFEVTLRAPLGTPLGTSVTVSAANPTADFKDGAGNVLFSAEFVPATGSASRDHVTLNIARTAIDPAGGWGQAVAWSGLWQVIVKNQAAARIDLDAWIRRSDTMSGRRAKGRQSYFDDPRYGRFTPSGRPRDFDPLGSTSYVRRLGTLSGIATGQEPRVIGGFRNSDFYPAWHSSHGARIKGGAPVGPDWLECTDASDVLRGVHASGTQSGSVYAMSGTSAAAPQAARWVAEQWLSGNRPPLRSGLLPIVLYPDRPIPIGELPIAVTNGRARFAPRWPSRR
jgi:hypothetical protein